MKGFDGLWNAAVATIRRPGRPAAARDAALGDRLRDLSFPAILAVLGAGQARHRESGAGLLDQVRRQAGGAEGAGLRRALEGLFVGRRPPGEAGDAALLGRAIQAAGGIVRPGLPVTPEEAMQVVALLRSGEFFGDVADTTSAVVELTRELPPALVRDIPRTPATLGALGQALIHDGGDAIGHLDDLAADLLDGRLDRPPHALGHTLRWLYGHAGAAAVAEAMRKIIAPDNQTARLALLIYARANGIPLTPEGLDALYTGPLDPGDPDLGPALAAGLKVLAAQHGENGVIELLGRLRRRGAVA